MKNGKRILDVTVSMIEDADYDPSYLEQEGFESRLAEYCNGDFAFNGVRATAEVQLEANGAIQTLTSGGLWGIESDSDKAYFAEIAAEELADLKSTLEAAGFSKRAIATACKGVTL